MTKHTTTSGQDGKIDSHAIWAIAIPAMITNVATALIGIGDIWIVGQLGSAASQGAIDVGARFFAVLFTVMNFLKTGTTGLVAQAGTKQGEQEQVALLLRGLVIGLAIAFMLLLARPILLPVLLDWLGARGAVRDAAQIYANIRFWSAPAVMANLALIGFMVGRRQMKAVLLFEIGYNLANIGLGLWLALGLDMGIAGIGWSSLVAEYLKLIAVSIFIARGSTGRELIMAAGHRGNLGWQALRPFLTVNRDLFLRTVILMTVLAVLTRLSAERGEVVLAANGILYQLFVLTALLLDGFENSAQVLNGERYGARDRNGFVAYIKAILLRGLGAATLVAVFFALFSSPILANFAATEAVAQEAQRQAYWLALIPFAGVAGFVFDGVFVGASWTRSLLITMASAALCFTVSAWLTWPLGNQGLWLSFVLFLVLRAIFQLCLIPRQVIRSFG